VVTMAKHRNFPLVTWAAELELYATKSELSGDELERACDLFSLTRARLNALAASMQLEEQANEQGESPWQEDE